MACIPIRDSEGRVVGIACTGRGRGGSSQEISQVLAEARSVAERERPAELAGREESEPRPNSPEDVGYTRPEAEETAENPRPPAPPVGQCRSCSAPVYWAVTATGADMPVDVEPVANGNVQLHWNGDRILAVYLTGDVTKVPGPRRVSHFATCKDAKAWRKK